MHQHAKFQAIPSMRSLRNARKPQIWPVSLSQNSANIRKTNRPWPELISSKGGQDTSACKISGHSLHAFSGKCPETSPDGRTDMPQNGHGWSDGPTDPFTGGKIGISGFGRTDGRTDGQPENIMPPAPKGGGIKMQQSVTYLHAMPDYLTTFCILTASSFLKIAVNNESFWYAQSVLHPKMHANSVISLKLPGSIP